MLFSYNYHKLGKEGIELYIGRKITSDFMHGIIPGFKLASNWLGKATLVPAGEMTTSGKIWPLNEDDLRLIDNVMSEWQREQHKVIVFPFFPFVNEAYIIDAHVYVERSVTV